MIPSIRPAWRSDASRAAVSRRRLSTLEELWLVSPAGTAVPLVEVADVTEGRGYSTIRRVDRERTVTVSADCDDATNPEIVASAMSGEVTAIAGALPGIEIDAAGALGKARRGNGDHALEDAGEAVLVLRRGFAGADPDGAGDVGGAVDVLAARIAQVDAAGLDRDVGIRVHPVVRQRGVRSRSADRVERQVAQGARRLVAEGTQLRGGGQLVQPALGSFDAQPVKILRDRRAVARLRRIGPVRA